MGDCFGNGLSRHLFPLLSPGYGGGGDNGVWENIEIGVWSSMEKIKTYYSLVFNDCGSKRINEE